MTYKIIVEAMKQKLMEYNRRCKQTKPKTDYEKGKLDGFVFVNDALLSIIYDMEAKMLVEKDDDDEAMTDVFWRNRDKNFTKEEIDNDWLANILKCLKEGRYDNEFVTDEVIDNIFNEALHRDLLTIDEYEKDINIAKLKLHNK